ncbi:hypothetical protein [Rhodoplanes sp. SY1]|uniref:hypothetical protein n=1 Tax=Rhodoplanes sp. SY1 TaxID=3166646 RepID=UPI0038B57F56
MSSYDPSPEIVEATQNAIVSTLPFVARAAVKTIPASLKQRATREALARVVPGALTAIAFTGAEGHAVPLTRGSRLTESVQNSLLARIVGRFTPTGVTDLVAALSDEVRRLARSQYSTGSWRLELDGDDAVLISLGAAPIEHATETVTEAFMASFEALRKTGSRIVKFHPNDDGDTRPPQ